MLNIGAPVLMHTDGQAAGNVVQYPGKSSTSHCTKQPLDGSHKDVSIKWLLIMVREWD